jgi:hypothetical protein
MRQPTKQSDERQKHRLPRIGWCLCAALFFAAGAILLATGQPAGYFWALLVFVLALVTGRPRSAVELRERSPRTRSAP